jgi:thymidylate synthase ThyX
MFSAKIQLDSLAPSGARLITFVLSYPRFIHPEFMTHRMFSRNTSSSRAIPYKKLRQQVLEHPAMPISWGENQRGMVAGTSFSEEKVQQAEQVWLAARDSAVKSADLLEELNLHKQHVNRLLEPFTWATVICSATTYDNFFCLRRAPDAQPEIRLLADLMYDAYMSSVPRALSVGEWHLPFVESWERQEESLETLQKISVARCARVSYLNFEGQRNVAADIGLFDRLASSRHWSPFEHIAQARDELEFSGNYIGFRQLRQLVEGSQQ